jgi:hypothetical protein
LIFVVGKHLLNLPLIEQTLIQQRLQQRAPQRVKRRVLRPALARPVVIVVVTESSNASDRLPSSAEIQRRDVEAFEFEYA